MSFVDLSGRPVTSRSSNHSLTQADGDYFMHAARSSAPEIAAMIPDLMAGVKLAAGIVGCLAIGAAHVISSSEGRSR